MAFPCELPHIIKEQRPCGDYLPACRDEIGDECVRAMQNILQDLEVILAKHGRKVELGRVLKASCTCGHRLPGCRSAAGPPLPAPLLSGPGLPPGCGLLPQPGATYPGIPASWFPYLVVAGSAMPLDTIRGRQRRRQRNAPGPTWWRRRQRDAPGPTNQDLDPDSSVAAEPLYTSAVGVPNHQAPAMIPVPAQT